LSGGHGNFKSSPLKAPKAVSCVISPTESTSNTIFNCGFCPSPGSLASGNFPRAGNLSAAERVIPHLVTMTSKGWFDGVHVSVAAGLSKSVLGLRPGMPSSSQRVQESFGVTHVRFYSSESGLSECLELRIHCFNFDSGLAAAKHPASGTRPMKSLVKYLPDFIRFCAFSGASIHIWP
jgi:hypothetical protein